MKTILLIAGFILAATAGWFAARHWPARAASSEAGAPATGEGRKILFYQSPMHPWIKSDKPGRCTICGMKLTPVYEGESGFDTPEGVTVLDSNSIQVIHVRSEPVTRQPLQRTLRVAGTIEEDDTRHRVLSAYVDGRIDRLYVNYVGAEVTEGQPLATFYSQALLGAERDYTSLLRQPGLDANAQLQAPRERMQTAARLRLVQYGLTPAQITALADKPSTNIHTEILAPMTGSVVRRLSYEGQYVKEGDPLFEIADFSTMWFQFDAYERDLGWIQPGQRVDVTTPAVAGKTFSGKITFIDPNLKNDTRSAKVRVELTNPLIETNGVKRRELYHRLYAEGRVRVQVPEVLAVPRPAVLNTSGNPVVYVDKGDGAYEGRTVTLGRVGDDHYEVLSGIEDGEVVVVAGNFLLDAQSQIHAGGAGHDHGAHGTETPGHNHDASSTPATPSAQPGLSLPPLTDAQRNALRDVLNVAVAMTTALAADDLAAYHLQSGLVKSKADAFEAVLEKGPGHPWESFLKTLKETAQAPAVDDLKAARKQFHPLSQAAVAVIRTLRRQDDAFQGVKVFRCPMTRTAFPGAPGIAAWIQFETPIRNPYFGAEMLDCGSEVKD